MLKRTAAIFLILLIAMLPVFALASSVPVSNCTELSNAIAAAKGASTADNPTVITLASSFEFDLTNAITVEGYVVIDGQGQYTLTRSSSYTGTFFKVASSSSLTLQNVTIDGNNNWTFDEDKYQADLAAMQSVPEANNTYVQPQSGAPMATAYMITSTGGTILLDNVAIKNNCSTSSGIISAGAGTSVTLNQTTITHCANTTGNGLVVNASGAGIKVVMYDGSLLVFKIYSGAEFTMNGGEIKNTKGWNSNGVVVGLYGDSSASSPSFILNGGTITGNSSTYGTSNGRNAAIYLHSNSIMEMNGGEIINNTGRARGGIDSSRDTSKLSITDGKVMNNVSIAGNSTCDVGGTTAGFSFSGGTFSQNVSKYAAEGYVCFQTDDTTWKIIPASMIYKINYELNGGQMNDYPEQFAVGYPFSIPDPTKDGSTFLGWTGSVGSDPVKSITFVNPTAGDITLIANWQENTVATPPVTSTGLPATTTPNVPKTGDGTPLLALYAMIAISLAVLGLTVYRKRKVR